jgi:hypothetical protein
MKPENARSADVRGEYVRTAGQPSCNSPYKEMQQLLRESNSAWAVKAREIMNAVSGLQGARGAGR